MSGYLYGVIWLVATAIKARWFYDSRTQGFFHVRSLSHVLMLPKRGRATVYEKRVICIVDKDACSPYAYEADG